MEDEERFEDIFNDQRYEDEDKGDGNYLTLQIDTEQELLNERFQLHVFQAMLQEDGESSVPTAMMYGGTSREADGDIMLTEKEHTWSLSACISITTRLAPSHERESEKEEKERLRHMYGTSVKIRNTVKRIEKLRYMIEMQQCL